MEESEQLKYKQFQNLNNNYMDKYLLLKIIDALNKSKIERGKDDILILEDLSYKLNFFNYDFPQFLSKMKLTSNKQYYPDFRQMTEKQFQDYLNTFRKLSLYSLKYEFFRPNQTIFNYNNKQNKIYIMIQGAAELLQPTENPKNLKLTELQYSYQQQQRQNNTAMQKFCQIRKGESVGQSAAFNNVEITQYKFKALSDCHFAVFEINSYFHVIHKCKQKYLNSLQNEQSVPTDISSKNSQSSDTSKTIKNIQNFAEKIKLKQIKSQSQSNIKNTQNKIKQQDINPNNYSAKRLEQEKGFALKKQYWQYPLTQQETYFNSQNNTNVGVHILKNSQRKGQHSGSYGQNNMNQLLKKIQIKQTKKAQNIINLNQSNQNDKSNITTTNNNKLQLEQLKNMFSEQESKKNSKDNSLNNSQLLTNKHQNQNNIPQKRNSKQKPYSDQKFNYIRMLTDHKDEEEEENLNDSFQDQKLLKRKKIPMHFQSQNDIQQQEEEENYNFCDVLEQAIPKVDKLEEFKKQRQQQLFLEKQETERKKQQQIEEEQKNLELMENQINRQIQMYSQNQSFEKLQENQQQVNNSQNDNILVLNNSEEKKQVQQNSSENQNQNNNDNENQNQNNIQNSTPSLSQINSQRSPIYKNKNQQNYYLDNENNSDPDIGNSDYQDFDQDSILQQFNEHDNNSDEDKNNMLYEKTDNLLDLDKSITNQSSEVHSTNEQIMENLNLLQNLDETQNQNQKSQMSRSKINEQKKKQLEEKILVIRKELYPIFLDKIYQRFDFRYKKLPQIVCSDYFSSEYNRYLFSVAQRLSTEPLKINNHLLYSRKNLLENLNSNFCANSILQVIYNRNKLKPHYCIQSGNYGYYNRLLQYNAFDEYYQQYYKRYKKPESIQQEEELIQQQRILRQQKFKKSTSPLKRNNQANVVNNGNNTQNNNNNNNNDNNNNQILPQNLGSYSNLDQYQYNSQQQNRQSIVHSKTKTSNNLDLLSTINPTQAPDKNDNKPQKPVFSNNNKLVQKSTSLISPLKSKAQQADQANQNQNQSKILNSQEQSFMLPTNTTSNQILPIPRNLHNLSSIHQQLSNRKSQQLIRHNQQQFDHYQSKIYCQTDMTQQSIDNKNILEDINNQNSHNNSQFYSLPNSKQNNQNILDLNLLRQQYKQNQKLNIEKKQQINISVDNKQEQFLDNHKLQRQNSNSHLQNQNNSSNLYNQLPQSPNKQMRQLNILQTNDNSPINKKYQKVSIMSTNSIQLNNNNTENNLINKDEFILRSQQHSKYHSPYKQNSIKANILQQARFSQQQNNNNSIKNQMSDFQQYINNELVKPNTNTKQQIKPLYSSISNNNNKIKLDSSQIKPLVNINTQQPQQLQISQQQLQFQNIQQQIQIQQKQYQDIKDEQFVPLDRDKNRNKQNKFFRQRQRVEGSLTSANNNSTLINPATNQSYQAKSCSNLDSFLQQNKYLSPLKKHSEQQKNIKYSKQQQQLADLSVKEFQKLTANNQYNLNLNLSKVNISNTKVNNQEQDIQDINNTINNNSILPLKIMEKNGYKTNEKNGYLNNQNTNLNKIPKFNNISKNQQTQIQQNQPLINQNKQQNIIQQIKKQQQSNNQQLFQTTPNTIRDFDDDKKT